MGNNDSSVETFLQWIKASDNIVFFGGAGVSTESGIPDFRSVDGLYNQKYDYPPETILRHRWTAPEGRQQKCNGAARQCAEKLL